MIPTLMISTWTMSHQPETDQVEGRSQLTMEEVTATLYKVSSQNNISVFMVISDGCVPGIILISTTLQHSCYRQLQHMILSHVP